VPEYDAYVHLSREQVEMLLKLDIPDSEFVETLKHHLARYTEQTWSTLRIRFGLRAHRSATAMLRWCNEHFGDRNIIERRWYVASSHKTKYYHHITVAFRYPADQVMFAIFWHANLWTPPEKKNRAG
jgi:hypothetical protein